MKSAIIILKSNTEAHKAKNLLTGGKIKCAVEKASSKRGVCGYGVRIFDDPKKICRILENGGIKCLEVVVEGENNGILR